MLTRLVVGDDLCEGIGIDTVGFHAVLVWGGWHNRRIPDQSLSASFSSAFSRQQVVWFWKSPDAADGVGQIQVHTLEDCFLVQGGVNFGECLKTLDFGCRFLTETFFNRTFAFRHSRVGGNPVSR
jgi:hypothetical protein